MSAHLVVSWIGCPSCASEPRIITQTLDGAVVLCEQCGFIGRFSDCFASETAEVEA